MASPQLEHGHTRLANELLEHLATELTASGTQLAVMLLVARFSYGYQRKVARFTITEIAKALRIDRRNAGRAVQVLMDRNMLSVTHRPGHQRQEFQIQKNWKAWRNPNRRKPK